MRGWLTRLGGLVGRGSGDFEAELASHIEMHIEDGVRAGLSPEEARRRALAKLGGTAAVREARAEQQGMPLIENFAHEPILIRRQGRDFSDRDSARAPPVVIVNETLARRWWPNRPAIGGRIAVGYYQGKPVMPEASREVIGVTADMKTLSMSEPARPTLFIPVAQAAWYGGGMTWVLRAESAQELAEAVRRKVKDLDPSQRMGRVRPMTEIVAGTTADTRFDALLFGSFAGFALLVTAIGVYGLLSFAVARRTSEIGARMALGATSGDVLGMVLGQGMRLVSAGLAVGYVGAVLLARSLSKMLFGVGWSDPLSYAGVAALLLAVGFLASFLPAWRATRVDPLAALRSD